MYLISKERKLKLTRMLSDIESTATRIHSLWVCIYSENFDKNNTKLSNWIKMTTLKMALPLHLLSLAQPLKLYAVWVFFHSLVLFSILSFSWILLWAIIYNWLIFGIISFGFGFSKMQKTFICWMDWLNPPMKLKKRNKI